MFCCVWKEIDLISRRTLIVSPYHGPRHSRTAAARVGDGARDAELPGQGRGELTAGGQAVRFEVRLRAGGGTQEDHAGSDSDSDSLISSSES